MIRALTQCESNPISNLPASISFCPVHCFLQLAWFSGGMTLQYQQEIHFHHVSLKLFANSLYHRVAILDTAPGHSTPIERANVNKLMSEQWYRNGNRCAYCYYVITHKLSGWQRPMNDVSISLRKTSSASST